MKKGLIEKVRQTNDRKVFSYAKICLSIKFINWKAKLCLLNEIALQSTKQEGSENSPMNQRDLEV